MTVVWRLVALAKDTEPGPLARVQDGDLIRLDAVNGTIDCLAKDFDSRDPVSIDLTPNHFGMGREMFGLFRAAAGDATEGACSII